MQPTCQPFVHAKDGDAYMALFRKSELLELEFHYARQKRILMIRRNMALRDVQEVLCQAFHQRFPIQAASVTIQGRFFDEFDEMPFLGLEEGLLQQVDVDFNLASDMYFFDLSRRRRPSPDPYDDIPELVLDA